MSIEIKEARTQDCAELLYLARKLAIFEKKLDKFTATEQSIKQCLFAPHTNISANILWLNDDKAIGFSWWYIRYATFAGKTVLHLEDLFIESEHRSKGYGTRIIKHGAQIAKKLKCDAIELDVLEWNNKAIEFYKFLGATQLKANQPLKFTFTDEALINLAENDQIYNSSV